jgi:hypothetical protein
MSVTPTDIVIDGVTIPTLTLAAGSTGGLGVAASIDPVNDYLAIYQNSSTSTLGINRNTVLGLSSAPVGLTDTQTLTNKTLTSPTIAGPVLSGTVGGTYTLGGTPTFPASVATLTGTQVLTNKTLTSPTINSPSITNATLTTDAITGYTTSNSGVVYGGLTMTTGNATFSGNATVGGTLGVTGVSTFTGGFSNATMINPYKFSVYLAAGSLSVTNNTSSIVTCDTKRFDTGTNYSVSTGLFTAPIAGFYQFNGVVLFTSTLSTHLGAALLAKNGSFLVEGNYGVGNSSQTGFSVSRILQLAANDTVALWQTNTSGSAVTVAGGSSDFTYFEGYLVSQT